MKVLTQKIGSVTLLLLPAILITGLPALLPWLEYDRDAISEGQVWRLVTQNFCHWSWDHLIWDALAATVLALWATQYSIKQFLQTIILSSVMTSTGLYFWQADLIYARGLSGIDCALFGMVIFHTIQQAHHDRDTLWLTLSLVSLTAFIFKTIYEIHTQQTVFMDSIEAGIIALPLVHLIGLVCGMVVPVIAKYKKTPIYNHAMKVES